MYMPCLRFLNLYGVYPMPPQRYFELASAPQLHNLNVDKQALGANWQQELSGVQCMFVDDPFGLWNIGDAP